MATVEEVYDSRTGSADGLTDASGSTLWLVTTDEQTDDPRKTLQDHADGVRHGQEFPDDDSLVADLFVRGARFAPKVFHVHVFYRPGELFAQPIIPGWVVSFRGATTIERSFVTLPDAQGEDKVWGPNLYVFADDDHAQTHYAITGTASDPVKLHQAKGRRPIGYDADVPGVVMVLTKDTPLLPRYVGKILAGFDKTVNHSRFHGGAPGHLKVVELAIDPMIGQMPGSRYSGTYWRIRIVIFWSAVRLNPVRLKHTYPSEFGEVPIQVHDANFGPVNSFVWEDFEGSRLSDFYSLLQTFW